ncbi:MAG TPA: asparagine synthase-related protein [Allosphingosinicella sp.]|nr:asparagine synthase-related protein [Allosphingosinicella sp.]
MSAPRFLALAGEPGRLRDLLASLVPARDGAPRLDRRFDAADLVLFASPETALIPLEEERGVLVGRLYRPPPSSEPVAALDLLESRAAAWSGGRSLVEEKWGGYVAFLRDEGAVTIFRDPSGAVPVHHLGLDGVRAFFSHGALAADLGLAVRGVDEAFLRQWLTYPFLRTERTGIEGVSELLPGMSCRTVAGEARSQALWTPWTFTTPERRILDFGEAAAKLRSVLLGTVRAQLRGMDPPILELSGGLDSAIVAACLSSSGMAFSGANFVTRMADGDERDYARILADALHIPLAELHEGDAPLTLEPSPPRSLRPPLSPVLQPLHRAFAHHARAIGARTFVTGAGGDNLFCYLTTASPALDAASSAGLRQGLSTLADVAELGGCTLWTAAAFAIRKRLGRHRRPAWKRDDRFLAPGAAAQAPDLHPWLDPPEKTLPGKREHVDSLVRLQHFVEDEFATGERLLHPLLSQPLMELCLSIPTWLWLEGGRNRAVARAAFADLLPEEIILRRTKGRLESMCARAFAANRERLADLLLRGALAERGLLDQRSLATYLAAPGPPQDEAYFRIFDLTALELWLRSSV